MLSGTHYRSKHSPAGRGWLPSNSQRQAWKVNTQWHVNVRSVPLKGRTPAKVVTGLFFPLMSSKCPASFGMRRAPADTAEQLFPSRTPRGGGGRVGTPSLLTDVSLFTGTTDYSTLGQRPNGANQITEGRPSRSHPSLSSPQPRGLQVAQGLLLSLLRVPGSRQQTSSTDRSYAFQAAPSHPGTVN